MTSINEIGGITFNLTDTLPQWLPEEKFLVTLEPVEYAEAVSIAIQCRKTHPEESLEIYPREHGLFTVIRCVKKP